MDFEIRTGGVPDAQEAIRLYRQADWWEDGDSEEAVSKLFEGSFRVAEALSGNHLIGMGRALSDGAGDAYIQDVVVDRNFRGQGIGSSIVRTLVRELRDAGIGWIGLVGAPGTESFYRKLGFEVMKEHGPMRDRGEKR